MMKKMIVKSRILNRINDFVDVKLVAIGLAVVGLASCSSDQQGNVASPLLGVYMQVDHVGRPGVKEIFENYADHETSNRNTPVSDPALSTAITSFMTAVPQGGTSNARSATASDAAKISNVFYPDELQANLDGTSSASQYLAIEMGNGGFGGRAPSELAMEGDLKAVYGTSLGTAAGSACLQTDNLTPPTTTVTTFPYL